jgi:hypothetical protein
LFLFAINQVKLHEFLDQSKALAKANMLNLANIVHYGEQLAFGSPNFRSFLEIKYFFRDQI